MVVVVMAILGGGRGWEPFRVRCDDFSIVV